MGGDDFFHSRLLTVCHSRSIRCSGVSSLRLTGGGGSTRKRSSIGGGGGGGDEEQEDELDLWSAACRLRDDLSRGENAVSSFKNSIRGVEEADTGDEVQLCAQD